MSDAARHVVGVGASRGVPVGEVLELVIATLAEAGLSAMDVVELASVDTKGREPGIVGAAERLGVPLVTYSAARLAGIAVPNPSGAALGAVGSASVAEASALAGGGELVVPKRKSSPVGRPAGATCAVARRGVPQPPRREPNTVSDQSLSPAPHRSADSSCPTGQYGGKGTHGPLAGTASAPQDPYRPLRLFDSGRGRLWTGLDQAAPDMMTVVRAA